VQRAKLVLYAADGLDNVEIARRLDLLLARLDEPAREQRAPLALAA
jgi:hypothetical protein